MVVKKFPFFTARRYPREAYAFIIASLVNATGSAFLWPLTTIYVHVVLHHSYGDAGLVLLLQAFAGVVGQWLGGVLYYRIGLKMLLVSSLVLSGIAQFGIALVTNWDFYLCLMICMGLMMNVAMPVINALIGSKWPERRMELFNVVYVCNNLGMALGTTVGGVIATISFAWSFSADAISTIGFAVFFWCFLRSAATDLSAPEDTVAEAGSGNPAPEAPHLESNWSMLRNYRAYLFLGLGAMLTWFSTSVYGAGVAPYLTDKGLSPDKYSFLWTVNGIVILAGQPVLSVISRVAAKSMSNRLIGSAVWYLIGFGFIAFFHGTYMNFVIAMVLTTFGEMWLAPSIPAFITETTQLAAPFYLGVVGAMTSLGRMVGPFVFGNMYDAFGLWPIFGVISVLLTAACAAFIVQRRFTLTQTRPLKLNLGDSTSLAQRNS